MFNPEFKNKNYLIIGAANGMGETLARYLADCKANLFLLDSDPKLKDLCKVLARKTKCEGHLCDLKHDEGTIQCLLGIKTGFDGIVYFTRGRQKYAYENLDKEKWNADFRLNVESFMYIIHQLWVRKKINKHASVVVLSTICTKYAAGLESLSYIMSKSALESMSRCLAAEFGPRNVRVNTLQLGFIVKDEHKKKFYAKDNAEYRRWAEGIHPLRRVGHNDDVVGPIKFLLSRESSYLTGQVLCVDGGLTLQEPSHLVRSFMNVSYDAEK